MKSWLVASMLLIGCIVHCQAQGQNLIPNPSFEDISAAPNDEAQFHLTQGWESCSPSNKLPNATPDLYSTRSKATLGSLPKAIYGETMPKEGDNVAGLYLTYGFREYISVKLLQPLVPGRNYMFTMWVCNGTSTKYTNQGSNGLGISLSLNKLRQEESEAIVVPTAFMVSTPLYSQDWTKVQFVVQATRAFEYLTIGNFTEYDEDLKVINSSGRPEPLLEATYYFIDALELVESNAEPTKGGIMQPNPSSVVLNRIRLSDNNGKLISEELRYETLGDIANRRELKVVHGYETDFSIVNRRGLPKKFQDRDVVAKEQVEVNTYKVQIEIFDPKDIDGDRITLTYNGEVVLREYVITTEPKILHLNLTHEHNYLVFHADDIGKVPPNTARLKIVDKSGQREIKVNSDYRQSTMVDLKLNVNGKSRKE